jgi:hypothetical protein
MATLYITEFNHDDRSMGISAPPAAQQPAVVDQTVAIGGASVASAAFNANTNLVCLSTDVICSISFGLTPTATVTMMRLPADSLQYFKVPRGQAYKVAVIANT